MFYYNILPTRNIGGNLAILTFGCQNTLEIGQIVEIEIRNSEDYGLVISENNEIQEERVGGQSSQIETQQNDVSNNIAEKNSEQSISQTEKNSKSKSEEGLENSKKNNFEIKEITKVFPFKISKEQIEFLQSFTTNTFNSPNDIWSSIFQPFKLLTKKQILEIESNYVKNSKITTSINPKLDEFTNNSSKSLDIHKTLVKNPPIIDFILDSEIIVRIMYIIRSLVCSDRNEIEGSNSQQKQQVLIVFPEKKYLDKIMQEFTKETKKQGIDKQIEILKYSGEPTKTSKEAIWKIIENSNQNLSDEETENNKVQIIFGTRSAIFLPYSCITQIILIDEGNSLYIQDQNSLYFDARDAIFLLHKAFLANLTFVSTLPSLRLHSFYDKAMLKQIVNYSLFEVKKPVNLRITTLDTKSAKFGLFGWEIEQILRKDEDLE